MVEQRLLPYRDYRAVPTIGTLTVANLITDDTRTTGTQGDGLAIGSGAGVWPAATNRNVNGNATTNTAGVTDNSSTTSRVTTGTVKFGATAFEVVSGNATANEGPSQAISGGAAATVYTISAWAWLVSGAATVRVALYDSVSGKQGGTPVVLTTTPVRLTVTAMTGAASAGHASYVETTTQQAGTWRIGGWQVETGSIATPYIHTDGGTASRSLGRYYTDVNPLLNGVQGWVAARLNFGGFLAYAPVLSLQNDTDSASDNRVVFDAGGASGRFRVERRDAATTTAATMGAGDAVVVGDDVLLVARWSASAVGIAKGGGAWVTTASTNTFSYNNHRLDTRLRWNPTVGSYTRHYWIAAGAGIFADSDLATLQAFGNNRPLPHQLPHHLRTFNLAHFYGDGTVYRYRAA